MNVVESRSSTCCFHACPLSIHNYDQGPKRSLAVISPWHLCPAALRGEQIQVLCPESTVDATERTTQLIDIWGEILWVHTSILHPLSLPANFTVISWPYRKPCDVFLLCLYFGVLCDLFLLYVLIYPVFYPCQYRLRDSHFVHWVLILC